LWAMTNRLPDLFERVKELERKLRLLEEGSALDSPTENDKSGD
jgi:hypothetical protein